MNHKEEPIKTSADPQIFNDQYERQIELLKKRADDFASENVKLQNILNKIDSELTPTKQELSKYKEAVRELKRTRNELENEILKRNEEQLENEQHYMLIEQQKTQLEAENRSLQSHLKYFRNLYEEMEDRKNNELESILRENHQLQKHNKELRSKIESVEKKVSNINYELISVKQEVVGLTTEREHLSKILSDKEELIYELRQKEETVEQSTGSLKNKLRQMELRCEKQDERIRSLENQKKALTENYDLLSRDSQARKESEMNKLANRYKVALEAKTENVNTIKADLLALRFEKDKFEHECVSLKGEYDKLVSMFKSESDKHMSLLVQYEKEKK